MSLITRFAPSPTGSLHLGGARTALFNYIYAKSKKGKFKLRIEDTDKSRNLEASTNSIIKGLDWMGIKHDGEIIYQSNMLNEHKEIVKKMLYNGFAYKCFHTESEVTLKKKKNKKFRSEWRDKKDDKKKGKFCIRIKSPIDGNSLIHDKIQGIVKVDNKELDDFIIVRENGSPTFLLSSAVDDFLMLITHIIRGDDHLTNSFRQLAIFKFLKHSPTFAHLPLIHNEKNEKLSKRDNVQSIEEFKKEGYLPESLINYLLRLGWSYKNNEIISIKDALNNFSLEKIGKSPSKIDHKKLFFLNNFYIKNKNDEELYDKISNDDNFKKFNFSYNDRNKVVKLIGLLKERCNKLSEIIKNLNWINKDFFFYENSDKNLLKDSFSLKSKILSELTRLDTWNDYIIEKKLNDIINQMNLKFKEIGQPLRLSICGKLNGPSIVKIMAIIGKEETINKISNNWKKD